MVTVRPTKRTEQDGTERKSRGASCMNRNDNRKREPIMIRRNAFSISFFRALSVGILVGITIGSVRMESLTAAEPITLVNAKEPAPNRGDEPVGPFSLQRAVHFLDNAALDWQNQRKCFTCHTNFAFLYARPQVNFDDVTHSTVRRYAEELVLERWPDQGPRWDAEVVATAAALAFNDAATTGKLQETTRIALDKMWTLQKEDGGWNWLKCDWPPMESDDHYGATLAAIAVGVAPNDYAQTPLAQQGMAKLRAYLKANAAPTLHHESMQLWAAKYQPDLISGASRESTIRKLLDLQKEDGGWNLASLGNWERGDKSAQDIVTSDGYATGFVIYVLRSSGIPANDKSLQRGIAWLKANQRESGRWFTRSLHADSKHFISHAGTAFAIMALQSCEP